MVSFQIFVWKVKIMFRDQKNSKMIDKDDSFTFEMKTFLNNVINYRI
jgi:hypothetical protein